MNLRGGDGQKRTVYGRLFPLYSEIARPAATTRVSNRNSESWVYYLYNPTTRPTCVKSQSYIAMEHSSFSVGRLDDPARVHPRAVQHRLGIGLDGDAGLRGERKPDAADHVAQGWRHRRPPEPRERPLRPGGRRQPQDHRREGGGRRRVPVQERECRGLGGRGRRSHGSGW